MKFCVNCGTKMEESAKFCPSCGTGAAQQQSAQTPTAPYSQSQETQAYPAGMPQQPQNPAYYQDTQAPQQPAYTQQNYQYEQTAQPQYVQQPTPGQPGPRQSARQPVPPPYGNTNSGYARPDQPGRGSQYPSRHPGGGNQYTRFSGEMNAGNMQRRTNGRGVLIGGIIALVVLAVIIAVVVLIFAKPPADKPSGQSSGQLQIQPQGNGGSVNANPSGSSQQGGNQLNIPASGTIKRDATLEDIIGEWNGDFQFTRVEGYETLPPDELPEDYKDMLDELLSGPAPVEFYVNEEGHWEIYINVISGMQFSSYEYDYNTYESSPMKMKLNDGVFNISYSENYDDESSGTMKLDGTVTEDSQGLRITATFYMSYREGDMYIIQEGGFTVTPDN